MALSNNNQLSQTTHHIPSLIQSHVHSCRQSPALPDTGDTQPDTRSPSLSIGHSTQPMQSLSDPSPTPRTSEVHTNERDIDSNKLQPLAAGHTLLEPPVSSSLSRPPLSREETESASAPLSRDHEQRSAPRRHSAPKRHSSPTLHASKVSILALDSRLQNPPPLPPLAVITQPLARPASKKRPYSEYKSEDNTHPLRDPTGAFDSRLQSPSPSAPPAIITQPLARPTVLKRPTRN